MLGLEFAEEFHLAVLGSHKIENGIFEELIIMQRDDVVFFSEELQIAAFIQELRFFDLFSFLF